MIKGCFYAGIFNGGLKPLWSNSIVYTLARFSDPVMSDLQKFGVNIKQTTLINKFVLLTKHSHRMAFNITILPAARTATASPQLPVWVRPW